ncbi:hypothetical protein [Bacillus anthracis]
MTKKAKCKNCGGDTKAPASVNMDVYCQKPECFKVFMDKATGGRS